VVLLGAVAAKALLPGAGAAGIRRLRGQWKQLEWPGLVAPIACLPTYHPAYLLRTPGAKRESWHDLIALRQWLNDDEI
jgi:DNA polymerase